MEPLLNRASIDPSICEAAEHYAKSAPTVADWLDDLCIRLSDKPDTVLVCEFSMVDKLHEDGVWMQPNYAVNQVYHMLHRLGRDVTGQAGF